MNECKRVLFLFFLGLCGCMWIWKDQRTMWSRAVVLSSKYLDIWKLFGMLWFTSDIFPCFIVLCLHRNTYYLCLTFKKHSSHDECVHHSCYSLFQCYSILLLINVLFPFHPTWCLSSFVNARVATWFTLSNLCHPLRVPQQSFKVTAFEQCLPKVAHIELLA